MNTGQALVPKGRALLFWSAVTIASLEWWLTGWQFIRIASDAVGGCPPTRRRIGRLDWLAVPDAGSALFWHVFWMWWPRLFFWSNNLRPLKQNQAATLDKKGSCWFPSLFAKSVADLFNLAFFHWDLLHTGFPVYGNTHRLLLSREKVLEQIVREHK
jgi:hypothetical protein